MNSFSLRGCYPIRREFEFSHIIRKFDAVDIPVDATAFAATCADTITSSVDARYTSLPKRVWGPMLEEFIADIINSSNLDLIVTIGAFATIERQNYLLLRQTPPSYGYLANTIEDACRLFLGAYMSSAMMIAADDMDSDVHNVVFWQKVTRGAHDKDDLREMEMIFADSVREVRVGGAIWNIIVKDMMLSHHQRVRMSGQSEYLEFMEHNRALMEMCRLAEEKAHVVGAVKPARSARHRRTAPCSRSATVVVPEKSVEEMWEAEQKARAMKRAMKWVKKYEEMMAPWR